MLNILFIAVLSVTGSSFFIQDHSLPSLTTVVFQGIYPQDKLNSTKIYIRGDSCNLTWTKGVPLSKTSTNKWTTSLLCPEKQKVSVKLLLNDSSWMMGANFIFTVQQGQTVSIYPSFNPKINAIVDTSPISSKILKNSRKLSIYYPPSYYDNTFKQYEVLLMHDGQNLFDPSKAAFGTAWMCQNAANNLIGQGKINEVIIVGIWNTNNRNNQYTYSYDPTYKFGGQGDQYLDFITTQLIPVLQSQILKGRTLNKYSIGGSSLGGLISCYGTYTRPTIFKKAICMSSSFWWNSEDFNNKILKSGTYSPSTSIYVDSGDSGNNQDSKNQTLRVRSTLKNIGYEEDNNLFYYLDKGGQHNQYYWGHRFHIPLEDMFRPS